MPNFYDKILESAGKWPNATALQMQYEDGRLEGYTYSEVRHIADSVGNWLSRTELARGSRCAILANNGPRWVCVYLGTLAAGLVAVPLDTAFTSSQVTKLLTDCGASLLFVDSRQLAKAREAITEVETPVRLVLLRSTEEESRLVSVDDMLGSGSGGFERVDVGFDDTAAILYTSGTTSDPKGVMLSHRNIDAEAESAFQVLTDIGPQDSILGVLPLFHALAQMANLLLPLIVGARIVFLESLNTTELLRALRERDITLFCCVPQFFYLIHTRIFKEVHARGRLTETIFSYLLALNGRARRFGINLGRLFFPRVHELLGRRMHYLITGGSRLDPQVGRDFEALGFTILNAYGLTETSGAATLTPPKKNVVGSVGRALPGNEVQILRPETDPETGHRIGEIAVRGGIVMKGYYNRPDATAAALEDGWLRTGDLGFMDAEGNVFITGRAKEVIVLSSGKNIYPEEIEAHYGRSAFIKEMCVLGIEGQPGEPLSERLHAVIVPDFDVLREQKIVNAREIIRYEIEGFSSQLPSTKRILSYEIWQEDLPRTTTRKLKRNAVEAQVRAGDGQRAEAEPLRPRALNAGDREWVAIPDVQRALEVVRASSKKQVAEVHPTDNLELDLGLDSMERVELLVSLERELGAHVPDGVVSEVYTVRELIDAVRSNMGSNGKRKSATAWGSVLSADPTEPEIVEFSKPHSFALHFWYTVGCIVQLFARDRFQLSVTGLEKLPKSGPFILSPNHQSYLDPIILLSVLPWRLFRDQFSVGTSEIFGTGLARKLAYTLNLVPVDPDANLVPAMRAGAFGLRRGKVLILFPEGERSIDGSPRIFKKGAAILSCNLQVPIYPVALDGFYEAWPRGKHFQRFAPLKMAFGDPIYPPKETSDPEAAYEELTSLLKKRVMEMWLALRGEQRPTENGNAAVQEPQAMLAR
ncbi:MAG TPA: AMP-binding protein [Terriglobales bacterium]|nr:AMP-binding protein [Terriglobales bacterium]